MFFCVLKPILLGTILVAIFELIYFTIRGGSRKKIEKKIIPSVPTNKKV